MPYDLANLSSILVAAHRKIAAIHIDLANKMQIEFAEKNVAHMNPPSSCSSDATLDAAAQQLVDQDDDFADSPVLSNANALQRARQQKKVPLINRMKLKKSSNDAPKRAHRTNGFMVFQAENRQKVWFVSTVVLYHHYIHCIRS